MYWKNFVKNSYLLDLKATLRFLHIEINEEVQYLQLFEFHNLQKIHIEAFFNPDGKNCTISFPENIKCIELINRDIYSPDRGDIGIYNCKNLETLLLLGLRPSQKEIEQCINLKFLSLYCLGTNIKQEYLCLNNLHIYQLNLYNVCIIRLCDIELIDELETVYVEGKHSIDESMSTRFAVRKMHDIPIYKYNYIPFYIWNSNLQE